MGLPTFLVIGAVRAGSTWLDALLRSHPQIYMPQHRKEVAYFDLYFDRGPQWYASYFPDEQVEAHRHAGESTPRYLYDPAAPARIQALLPDVEMIAILRNPVDRAYSHFGLEVRDRGERRSFERALAEFDELTAVGHYSNHLRRYAEVFGPERVLVLIFEEVIAAPDLAMQRLGQFLSVDPALFVSPSRANESYRPRFPRARTLAKGFAARLRRAGFDRSIEVAKRLGLRQLFGNAGGLPPMKLSTRRALEERFAPEVVEMENLLGREIPSWHGRA